MFDKEEFFIIHQNGSVSRCGNLSYSPVDMNYIPVVHTDHWFEDSYIDSPVFVPAPPTFFTIIIVLSLIFLGRNR